MADPVQLSSALQGLKGNQNDQSVVSRFRAYLSSIVVLAPQGVGQVGGIAFDYKRDDTFQGTAEATDHWLEDNRATQDHVGVRAREITIGGSVSELSMSSLEISKLFNVLEGVQSALTQTPAYLGAYAVGTVTAMQQAITQAQSVLVQAQQALRRGQQIANLVSGIPAKSRQQQVFSVLEGYRASRALITVYTPFQVFDNMVITSLRATQGERTRMISDFHVTLKQLQFTQSPFDPSRSSAGRNASDAQVTTSVGSTAGLPVVGGTAVLPTAFPEVP